MTSRSKILVIFLAAVLHSDQSQIINTVIHTLFEPLRAINRCRDPQPVTTSHQATGALLLTTTLFSTLNDRQPLALAAKNAAKLHAMRGSTFAAAITRKLCKGKQSRRSELGLIRLM